MGLAIYDEDLAAIASLTNKIVTSHNGTLGESVDVKLYLRNDDAGLYYQSISLQVQDLTNVDDTQGPSGSGWGVRLSADARRPTPAEWEQIGFATTISMPDIVDLSSFNAVTNVYTAADTTTYSPFWIRVSVPGNTVSLIKEEISLLVGATERLINT